VSFAQISCVNVGTQTELLLLARSAILGTGCLLMLETEMVDVATVNRL